MTDSNVETIDAAMNGGLDRANPATKGRCKKLIANWLANRVLVETKGRDPEKRRKVTAITAGPCVPGDAGEPS